MVAKKQFVERIQSGKLQRGGANEFKRKRGWMQKLVF